MGGPRLELSEEPRRGEDEGGLVPAPLPPDDPEAWYAPDIQAQYEVHPGVVVTITRTGPEFAYDVRDPILTAADSERLDRVESHFARAHLQRPRTHEGALETMDRGFSDKHKRAIDRLVDCSNSSRRRLNYHALAGLACFGNLTPYALDNRIEVADAEGDGIVVHTDRYAPAETNLPPEPEFLDRFASERIERHVVSFHEFEIPVVLYREKVLGSDPFETKYAVLEPDLLPGDETLIRECKDRLWETGVEGTIEDETSFVRDRAERFLRRQLSSRDPSAWVDAVGHRLRTVLSEYGIGVPPVDRRYAADRLADLVYYVLRDYVGYGTLTVPIRDPMLEDIEANRVGERIKVIPRGATGHQERVPTNLEFETERAFENVVTQLAAADGTELNATNPSAKVNLRPEGVDETIRCAVALPVISEDGPHISIRKQAPDVLTPVDLVERESISPELIALLWLCYEHHAVVLFSGPTGVGKTTLMNAHMPFVPFSDRPISIDEGSREVRLPHETGISLTTREHESEFKRVTMAELMTECNYLNPDVEVIAEVNTAESFETFAESLNTGHGLVGTTHAGDVETLVNRVIERGLAPYLLREIDLIVFPRHVDGDRYVGEVVELLSDAEYSELDRHDRCGVIEKGGAEVYWNTVAWRTHDGEFGFGFEDPVLGDERQRSTVQIFDRIAAATDRPLEDVHDEYRTKYRYVQYLIREGVTDFEELFDLLADLQTNEAATVERLNRVSTEQGHTQAEASSGRVSRTGTDD
ncbi:MAG: type II/IV secretion system ATPase subunit [Salinirussus sp.]